MDAAPSKQISAGTKGRSCGYKGNSSRKSKDRFYNSEDFMVNCFKVLPCFKKYRHDWWVCPYAHEGETAKRRDPKKFKYVGVACPDAKQGKACPRGDDCPCTHNVFEYWLHPTRFRTAFCGRGIHCTRPFCFFAHSLNEMRKPSLDDLLVVIQGDSLFNEEMLKRALEEHKKDVERLGGKDTNTELLDMSFLQTPQADVDLNKESSPPPSPSTQEILHGHSPRGPHSPIMRTVHHSPARVSSRFRGQQGDLQQSPMRDSYMRSPRDLSPGPDMSRGRSRGASANADQSMRPNMQSPREVLGFMNTVLMQAQARDLSPENIRFVQNLRDEAAALMTATPSPRDLSPQARHSPMDMYGYSPRDVSPQSHHISPGRMGSGAASHRDISPIHSVDGALLDAMRSLATDDDQANSLYGGTDLRTGLPPSTLSPRQASWHEGEMAELVSNAVHMESVRDGNMPCRRTAGAYEGGKPNPVTAPMQRSISMTTGEPQANLLEMQEMQEMLAGHLQRSHSGTGLALAAQQGQGHIDMQHHSAMPMVSAPTSSFADVMQTHSAAMQDLEEALIRDSMRNSLEIARSTSFHEPRHPSPGHQRLAEAGVMTHDVPPSLKAVLRSLSKEDQGYIQEAEESSAARPFSSLEGLW